MKFSFTKTAILSICMVLGLTIGISSAFGQKLAAQSQIKGEVPLDYPNSFQKKQMVPEHLKPDQQEESQEQDPPSVKGEKPVDLPKNHDQQRRLAPEPNTPKTENNSTNSPSDVDEKPDAPKQDRKDEVPISKENPENTNSDPDLEKIESPKPNDTPKPSESSSSNDDHEHPQEEPSQKANVERKNVQQEAQNRTPTESNHSDKEKTEIEIPEKVEIESSDGKKVDVTSVIQDIFGEVNASKEESASVQKKMENEKLRPNVALRESNQTESEKTEDLEQNFSTDNLPRTVEHGIMPMTASNDLQGVLIGLVMAIVGALYILFRKGEQR